MENEKLNEMLVDVWDSLTDEQKAKAKACKTPDELVKLAAEEGIELPDEVLEAVSGGYLFQNHGSQGIEIIRDSDGEYLGSVDTSKVPRSEIRAEAERQARAKGQSAEWIQDWDTLNRLRSAAKKKKKGC